MRRIWILLYLLIFWVPGKNSSYANQQLGRLIFNILHAVHVLTYTVGPDIGVNAFAKTLLDYFKMEKIKIFRILVFIVTVFGFISCFVALLIPFWLRLSNDAFDGHHGLFTFCIDNYGGNVACSGITRTNVGSKFRIIFFFILLKQNTTIWNTTDSRLKTQHWN